MVHISLSSEIQSFRIDASYVYVERADQLKYWDLHF